MYIALFYSQNVYFPLFEVVGGFKSRSEKKKLVDGGKTGMPILALCCNYTKQVTLESMCFH